VDFARVETSAGDDQITHGVGHANDGSHARVAVLPAVGGAEGKRDTAVNHQDGMWSQAECGEERNRMRPALVHVDDVGALVVQALTQAPGRAKVERPTKRQAEKLDPGRGAGLTEIAAGAARDGHVVAATCQDTGGIRHLHDRAGGEEILVDQVENAEWNRHRASIGAATKARRQS